MPPIERPAFRPPEARVEGHQVAGDDLVPRGQGARDDEPCDDGQRRRGDAGREDRDRRRERAAPSARDDRDEDQEHRSEQAGMRLDRDAGAQGQPAPREARAAAGALGPARDAERGQQEEGTEQEIALPRLPGAGGQVVRREEQAGAGRREPPPGRGERRGGERRRGEPGEIEGAPSGIAGTEQREHRHVHQVHAREIHVEEVPIRHRALADPPGDVVHQRRVVDQRPAARAPCEHAHQHGQGEDDQHADQRRPLTRGTLDRGSRG